MRHFWISTVLASCMLLSCGQKEQTANTSKAPDPDTSSAAGTATPPPASTPDPAPAAILPGAVVVPSESPTNPAPPAAGQDATATALDLARKSGCLACHNVDKKVVGPAWKEVAVRYKGDAGAKQRLIEKIKKGGKGNWTALTGGAPMPPYSPRVPDADIEALVDFVLHL